MSDGPPTPGELGRLALHGNVAQTAAAVLAWVGTDMATRAVVVAWYRALADELTELIQE